MGTIIAPRRRERYYRAVFQVIQLVRRSRHMPTTIFNINVLTEKESLHYFRFKKDDIAVVMKPIGRVSGK